MLPLNWKLKCQASNKLKKSLNLHLTTLTKGVCTIYEPECNHFGPE